MARKYKSLSYDDRKKIEILYKKGMSYQKIANTIGVCKMTIVREMKRGRNEQTKMYEADKAQRALLR